MCFGQKSLFCIFLTVLKVIRRKNNKKKIRHTRRHKHQLNFPSTARNIRKFTKFSCYKGNVKFDNIYDVFEERYLKITEIVLNFS